jgi:hypothetical protein
MAEQELLVDCYRSGQISERQWQEHLKEDPKFWRPNPFTSDTVIPSTPISDKASLTSSSLNGLMTALTNFIFLSFV